jgi:hypothetical protein
MQDMRIRVEICLKITIDDEFLSRDFFYDMKDERAFQAL